VPGLTEQALETAVDLGDFSIIYNFFVFIAKSIFLQPV
jgi:hypothetical protein